MIQTSSFSRHLRLPAACILLVLLASGCASNPSSRPATTRSAPSLPPPRTELVLLNIPEGSGWVAYRQKETDPEVENYRIVVIRQSTNELIYDSVIPLSASMATHGFELAKDDPRLQNLARNVDSNIIIPLEQVAPVSAPPPAGKPTTRSEQAASSPVESAPVEEPSPTPAPKSGPEPESEAPAPTELKEAESDYSFLEQAGNQIFIDMPEESPLTPGDRLFVREPDRTIALPGTGEQILVSRGTVTGLVTVESVEDNRASARLLSGYLPEDPRFELNEAK